MARLEGGGLMATTTTTEELADLLAPAVARYLEERGCSTWGRAFNIHDPVRRAEAAEWLTATVTSIVDLALESIEGVP